MDGNQEYDDDEFLYLDETNFQEAVGFECDGIHPAQCSKGDILDMPAGHYFKGKKQDRAISYTCKTGGTDKWKPVETPDEN